MKFEYNTQRSTLVLPEYGRNIQKLVEQAMEIKDRDERNRYANGIISIMANVNPHYKDNTDFTHKLWDHLAIMSNFQLDVDYPYEIPTPEILNEKPSPIPYSKNQIKFKHYGKTIELMIEEAVEMKDGEVKDYLTRLIANHMKRLYLTWNNDDMVQDKQILKDLEILSDGKIKKGEDFKLIESRDLRPKKKKQNTNHKKRYKK